MHPQGHFPANYSMLFWFHDSEIKSIAVIQIHRTMRKPEVGWSNPLGSPGGLTSIQGDCLPLPLPRGKPRSLVYFPLLSLPFPSFLVKSFSKPPNPPFSIHNPEYFPFFLVHLGVPWEANESAGCRAPSSEFLPQWVWMGPSVAPELGEGQVHWKENQANIPSVCQSPRCEIPAIFKPSVWLSLTVELGRGCAQLSSQGDACPLQPTLGAETPGSACLVRSKVILSCWSRSDSYLKSHCPRNQGTGVW